MTGVQPAVFSVSSRDTISQQMVKTLLEPEVGGERLQVEVADVVDLLSSAVTLH